MHLNPRNRSRGHSQQGNPLVPRYRVTQKGSLCSPKERLHTKLHTTQQGQPTRCCSLTHHASRFTFHVSRIPWYVKVSRRRSMPPGAAPSGTLSPLTERKPTRNQLRSSGHPPRYAGVGAWRRHAPSHRTTLTTQPKNLCALRASAVNPKNLRALCVFVFFVIKYTFNYDQIHAHPLDSTPYWVYIVS
jgi:hypothetical protein